jgi:phosphoribosylformimino-5-aminoimidazole carboxamide ribotide isomerase
MYLADLNAIAGGPPAWATYGEIQKLGCDLWVDAGIRNPGASSALVQKGIEHIVVGLETIEGPNGLEEICKTWGNQRVIFSLDLKAGLPLGNVGAWNRPEAWAIALQAIGVGVRRIIVLDLARVGTAQGLGTEPLCQRLSGRFPEVEIIAGGGVRHEEDLERLQQYGIRAVLVASALHDGSWGAKPASG